MASSQSTSDLGDDEGGDDRRKQEKVNPTYDKRYLTCPVCQHIIDTIELQLFCKQGFRDVHCDR